MLMQDKKRYSDSRRQHLQYNNTPADPRAEILIADWQGTQWIVGSWVSKQEKIRRFKEPLQL